MNNSSACFRNLLLPVTLLLALWMTRVAALDLLPLHNDEGLHLTRAVEVWNGHPFWAISDGKIVNHWLIAVFYPQHAPAFVARIATVFVAMIGLAAGYRLALQLSGRLGGVMAGVLWIASPYLFFYERLAFSDAEAGALVVLALWCGLGATRLNRTMGGLVVTGLALGAAMLFKFTAAPYALGVAAIIMLLGKGNLRERGRDLTVVVGVTATCFVIPLVYLLAREKDLFGIALGWLGGSSGGTPSLVSNLERLWAQLSGFGTLTWVLIAGVGLVLGVIRRRDGAGTVWLAGALPFGLILVLGREVLSRHFVVGLPILLTLAGIGLGMGLLRIKDAAARPLVAGLGVVALVFGAVPFALRAYTDPAGLPLPADAHYEHITSHSSGYGLREAMLGLRETITRRELPILGSMFPDSCARANFYAVEGLRLVCVGAPGQEAIQGELAERGAVYVLADTAPIIGVEVGQLGGRATEVARYARPGEAEGAVALWLVEGE